MGASLTSVSRGAVPVSNVDARAFTPDELRDGWRLACRAQATEDLLVEVPPLQTRPKAALAGVGRHVILRPAIQKRHLTLAEPTPSGLSVKGQFSLPEKSTLRKPSGKLWTHPVIANGRLYLRDQELLFCYQIKG